MLDVSVSYNRFRFMGNEFLTWLWFSMEKDRDGLQKTITPELSLSLGNRTVLENRSDAGVETISIKGDDAGLEEARLALKKGAMVSELNLRCERGDKRWIFTIKGESMAITNLKMPEAAVLQSGEDIEGLVIEKAYLLETVISLLDNLFGRYVKLRVSKRWHENVVPAMKKWIIAGAAVPTA